MSEVYATRAFDRWLRSVDLEDADLLAAIDSADAGLVDVRLGSALVKLRIARKGSGKRDGYRTIIAYKEGERSFFLEGYGKNERSTLSPTEMKGLRTVGKVLQSQDAKGLDTLLKAGAIREIVR